MSRTRKPKTVGQLQAERGLPADTLRNPGKDGQPGKNALEATALDFDELFRSVGKVAAQELTDDWQPYTGGYLKQPYALKLNDGREIDWAWPNAGIFIANKPKHEHIELTEVTHVKRALDWHFYGNTTPIPA